MGIKIFWIHLINLYIVRTFYVKLKFSQTQPVKSFDITSEQSVLKKKNKQCISSII